MVAWNRNCKVWSHGCFFCLAKMGKVEKTRFERKWMTFVNPAFSAAWKSPPKMVAWNRNCKVWSHGCFFCLAKMGKVEKTRFERKWMTFVNPAFSAAWKSPPKMVAWNRNFKIRSQRCFFVSPRWGNLTKRVLNAIGPLLWTRLSAAWKSPPKMVAWNRNFKIRSHGCFFVWPRWEKLKKRVLNAIGLPSSTRVFPLLGKAHPKWWHETEILKFDPKGVFSFPPDGEI